MKDLLLQHTLFLHTAEQLTCKYFEMPGAQRLLQDVRSFFIFPVGGNKTVCTVTDGKGRQKSFYSRKTTENNVEKQETAKNN